MRKRFFSYQFLFSLLLVSLLCINIPVVLADSNESIQQKNVFDQVYDLGRSKGILNDQNMSKEYFEKLCSNVLFPDYLSYSQNNPGVSFQEYVSDDNFEVPKVEKGDHPTEVNARTTSSKLSGPFVNFISAKSGYSMKAGDILICYGGGSSNNSLSNFPGHAAIATSAGYILEMPGTKNRSAKKNARHINKKEFFTAHTKGNDYVCVYRISKHPHYANDASTYAYNYMYKDGNPTYSIVKGYELYKKSPSYCSKYVYYAYWKGATSSAVNKYPKYWWVKPHSLPNYFSKSFHPSYIHKITKY